MAHEALAQSETRFPTSSSEGRQSSLHGCADMPSSPSALSNGLNQTAEEVIFRKSTGLAQAIVQVTVEMSEHGSSDMFEPRGNASILVQVMAQSL